MSKWLRKAFVVMVTILTFGLVTPSQAFLNDLRNEDRPPNEDAIALNESKDILIYEQDEASERDLFIQKMIKEAETSSYEKFGYKIKPVIEDEFREIILPNMERVITDYTKSFPEEDLKQLAITESSSHGQAEKIFHIRNNATKKDMIRFHVRTDRPPKEGYWFNFHYHTDHDQFEAHHLLGEIYWDKNTPPKWKSNSIDNKIKI